MGRLIEPFMTYLDANGAPLAGGFLQFNESGSPSTAKATYSDAGLTTANDNPIVLDSAGRAAVSVFGSGTYRMIVKNSAGTVQGTFDNIRPQSDAMGDFTFVRDYGGTVTYSTIQDAFDGADGRVLMHRELTGDPTVSGVVSLTSGLEVFGGKYHSDNSLAQFFTWPSGTQSDNVSLLATEIETDAGIAVHHNARADGTLIALSRITADGYGLLSNSSSDNSTGFVALGNYIYSDKSDAIEWNHPDENSSDFIAIGNVLTASTNGSSVSSGFAVGIAGTQYHVTIGNIVKESRQEAFHVEDGQTGGIIIGNSAHGLQEDGIHILAPASGSGAGDGVIVHGNFLYHEGLQTGFYGVRCVGDSNGAQDLSLIGGNYVKGFDSGLRFGSVISSSAPQFFIADGNAADDCNVAVDVGKGSSIFGDNISDGCATLFKLNNRAKAGRVFSRSEPTTIVSYAGTTSEPGGMCRGFVFPVEITHSASPNSQSFDLFSMADLLSGRLAIYLENGSNFFVYIADISWDGTTLTVTNPVSNNSGTVGSTTVINNSGALAVQFSTTSAITAKDVIVDFDGYYYKT